MDLENVKKIVSDFSRGKYKVISFLGSGAFADLYLVEHCFLNDTRVAKLIKKPVDSVTDLDFIFDEVRIACQLKHENIISIYDAGIIGPSEYNDSELIYFIIEYVPSGDLNQYGTLFRNSGILIPISWVISLMKQLSYGLNVLHSANPPLIHADLKPSNILLSFNSQDRAVVKISDFGFSREISSNFCDFIIGGTRQYMAPECFKKELNLSSDIYSLGVIFYLFLTNNYPYDVDKYELMDFIEGTPWKSDLIPPSEYNDEVSPLLDGIIMKCLEVDSVNRYANAGELIKDVEYFIEKSPYLFNKKSYFINNAIKKALRLAKYENKVSEAKDILEEYGMEVLIDEYFITSSKSENSLKTISLKNFSELVQVGGGKYP